MISIDELKSQCLKIHFFGLGFIQVKVSDSQRYHFYVPDLPSFTDHPHDHRYWFRSEVLRGSLRNIIWELDVPPEEGGERRVQRYDSCSSEDPSPKKKYITWAGVTTSFTTHEGSGYLMPINVFHQVEPLTLPCVTRISRGPKEKRFARVLDPIGHDYVCPFSQVIEEDTLWEHVRQAL